ncbi:hypothetical protein LL912_20850 [Niabella sp. CC-SYL272]|uniref:hypothetical protein n=1 Tax=Niabella agricola TaxID=2891571 RepID=UPI001F1599D7|nr:hypothetical protein [Niabella agricola]MCF3111248.1 hypothetical protein [Niabella agricola]
MNSNFHHSLTRRRFIRNGTLAGACLMMPAGWTAAANDTLGLIEKEATALLEVWGSTLLRYQVNRPGDPGLHGGLLCPACGTIHGRSGDAIFPLLLLAKKTKDKRYSEAAYQLYDWMEAAVSTPDGAWLNEVNVSDWKGTTVFAAIALAETIRHCSDIIDPVRLASWKKRLEKAGSYLYDQFNILTGNINYPVSCCYALQLIGSLLNENRFQQKAAALIKECKRYFTPNDQLLFGEGRPVPEVSPKGCYSIDLGYNVEESLPALVLYAKMTEDSELAKQLARSLEQHLEFMLPDGGWDNSWGTRNFKWTYWGSRTSDGCAPTYLFMADENPSFLTACLQNLKLMKSCTHSGLLYGGPHNYTHHILPCIHHTFTHSKSLATLLAKPQLWPVKRSGTPLARQKPYGIRYFKDVDTCLVSFDQWVATLTAYDQEYNFTGGHATGGALTMLWHPLSGPLLTASMGRYQMVEAFNMQRDDDPDSICLTPRFEVSSNGKTYSNIYDKTATITADSNAKYCRLKSESGLTDELQQPLVAASKSPVVIEHTFRNSQVFIDAACTPAGNDHSPVFFLPLICLPEDQVRFTSDSKVEIQKKTCIIKLETDQLFEKTDPTERRFNHVPGLMALPLRIHARTIHLSLSIQKS